MSYIELVQEGVPGVRVLLEASDADYQGDTDLLLVVPGSRFGYLGYGWGSCSGCDSYEACTTPADFAGLRDELTGKIHWEQTPLAMALWLTRRDWQLQYGGDRSRQFVDRAVAILSEYDPQLAPGDFRRALTAK